MIAIDRAEVNEFLRGTQPALVGVVATIRSDASPHAVPVWYRWDGTAVTIWSDRERAWVRNVAREPRVAFTVATSAPPYPAVVVHGRAALEEEPDHVERESRRIVERYVPEGVDDYLARWPGPFLIVRITPDDLHAWSDAG